MPVRVCGGFCGEAVHECRSARSHPASSTAAWPIRARQPAEDPAVVDAAISVGLTQKPNRSSPKEQNVYVTTHKRAQGAARTRITPTSNAAVVSMMSQMREGRQARRRCPQKAVNDPPPQARPAGAHAARWADKASTIATRESTARQDHDLLARPDLGEDRRRRVLPPARRAGLLGLRSRPNRSSCSRWASPRGEPTVGPVSGCVPEPATSARQQSASRRSRRAAASSLAHGGSRRQGRRWRKRLAGEEGQPRRRRSA